MEADTQGIVITADHWENFDKRLYDFNKRSLNSVQVNALFFMAQENLGSKLLKESQ